MDYFIVDDVLVSETGARRLSATEVQIADATLHHWTFSRAHAAARMQWCRTHLPYFRYLELDIKAVMLQDRALENQPCLAYRRVAAMLGWDWQQIREQQRPQQP